jgi:hypothetical protein
VTSLDPNALLIGGPAPPEGLLAHVQPGQLEVHLKGANGTGEHVWIRTARFQQKPGGQLYRVYVHFDKPITHRGRASNRA